MTTVYVMKLTAKDCEFQQAYTNPKDENKMRDYMHKLYMQFTRKNKNDNYDYVTTMCALEVT